MSLIYKPTGRALEYSSLALNIYKGCAHGCTYCFAPGATHRTREEFSRPALRSEQFIALLEKELNQLDKKGIEPGRVLLCFTCDPYQKIDVELKLTRRTIAMLHRWGYTVTVLTKGGTRALRDIDLFGPGDAFATTLTFIDDDKTREWEPGAATFLNRVYAIDAFHQAGVMTWASLEPVIEPQVSLEIAQRMWRYLDAFKVGTWNYDRRANEIDWRAFAHNVTSLLDSLGYRRQLDSDALGKGEYYIKKDLAAWLE